MIQRIWNKLVMRPYYKCCFGHFGRHVSLRSLVCLKGARHIYLGDGVIVKQGSWLEANPLTGETDCRLEIGAGSSIGYFNHIYATKRIEIGRRVITGNGVYIGDHSHGYEKIDLAVMDHPVRQLRPVHIGEGSWIGEHAAIIGASVGRHCVIGANSVVRTDIPDYCMAAGAPARIIKRYSFEEKRWKKWNHETNQ